MLAFDGLLQVVRTRDRGVSSYSGDDPPASHWHDRGRGRRSESDNLSGASKEKDVIIISMNRTRPIAMTRDSVTPSPGIESRVKPTQFKSRCPNYH